MSTIVVTPPAAAARVAVSKPSHSVRPGSLTWTCVSTMPGEMTSVSASRISAPAATSSYGATRTIVPCSIWIDAGRSASGRTTRWLRSILKLATTEDAEDTADQSLSPCAWPSVSSVSSVVERFASAPSRAFEERPRTRSPDECPVLDHEPAARQHGVGRAGHLPALVRVVVHVHVQRARGERDGAVRIEDDDVGVGAGRDRALARKESEDLRGRRRRQLDEPVERDASRPHAPVVHEAHARLDAGRAVGDLREVVPPELLLLLHAERTVIGGNRLQIVERQAAPEPILHRPLTQRRAHHVLGAVEARLL